MKTTQCNSHKGFTTIELAIVVVVIAVLSSMAVPRFNQMMEDADANNARIAQAQLEQVVSQASMRRDQSPAQMLAGQPGLPRVVAIVNGALGPSTPLVCAAGGANPIATCRLSSPSNRLVDYAILPNGRVNITALTGWDPNHFVVQSNTIVRVAPPAA